MIRRLFWEGFPYSQPVLTQIGNDNSDVSKTLQIPPLDAFLVHLTTQDCPAQEQHLDDNSVPYDALPADLAALFHPSHDAIAELHCRSGRLSFYLPRAALDEIADHVRERRVRTWYFRHGRSFDDPIIRSLSEALLPALAKPSQLSTLFVDHVGLALRAHIAHAYGGKPSTPPITRGGLAPWQVRRAKDLLSNKLNEETPVAQLARECGLSASHFRRAFRQSLGMAPHQWRLKVRVERAKKQLLNSDASLADIAVDCGFVDQSHFTRIFAKHVGAGPGQWRRQFFSGPAWDGDRERNQLRLEASSLDVRR
jgi:AraC-like DNA-binding protein